MKPLLRLEHLLKESGPAPDRPGWLALLLKRPGLWTFSARFLRNKFTPLILDRIRGLDVPLEERARLFNQAIAHINVGETYKTSGPDRTRLVDQAILAHAAKYSPLRFLEVGVSDGTASLNLLRSLPKGTSIRLTDRHPVFFRKGRFPVTRLYDGDRRLLGVKILGLYFNVACCEPSRAAGLAPIPTLNPVVRAEAGVEDIERFDVRLDAVDQPAHLIKCANLFNCKYFPAETIRAAVANLGRSLAPGGLLFISQNNARYTDGESYFALQRGPDGLVLVEEKNGHEAVDLFRHGPLPVEGAP